MSNNERIKSLHDLMYEMNLDMVVLSGRQNVYYFSSFYGDDTMITITADKKYIITDFRYYTQANEEAPDFELKDSKNGNFAEVITEISKEHSCRTIGIEAYIMNASVYMSLAGNDEDKRRYFHIKSIDSKLLSIRAVKSGSELKLIRKAASVADLAFNKLIPYIKPGISELDLAAELEYLIKKNGAQGTAFETIVVSGERSSMPHGKASNRKLKAGDAVTFDFGALYGGYRSDATRTIFIGYADDYMRNIYYIVLNAQKAALSGIKAGMTGVAADAIARDIIEAGGYGKQFGHGLGHGVGLDIHENPRLSSKYTDVLHNNSVVTVEPGIYIENVGGVRIEDMVIIKDEGVEILTKLDKSIIII